MKFREIFRFEVGYQLRRVWTWLFFVALFAIIFLITTQSSSESAREGGYAFNGPFVIASITSVGSLMTLLVTAVFAGDAGARDAQTRMHALVYTLPINKATYLSGQFLAAFALNAMILTAIPLALMLAAVAPGIDADLLGPFQPGTYISAYLVIDLGNAFVAMAVLFSMAALSRRAIAGYLGAVLLFFMATVVWQLVAAQHGHWELAKIIEPFGLTIMNEISKTATPLAKNTFSIGLNPSLLLNRAVWLTIASGVLALTHLCFRFTHPGIRTRRKVNPSQGGDLRNLDTTRTIPIIVPQIKRTFGGATRAWQTFAIAAQSFREIALSWGALVLGALTTILIIFGPLAMKHMGVPVLPTTRDVTNFVVGTGDVIWMVVPLLIIYYAGELVWRERETGLSEIADAAPVPEWVGLLGRYLGVAFVLLAYQAFLLVVCIAIQVRLGYYDFEIGLYARVLGLLLVEHIFLAAMAFAVHVLVNQKYAGHMIVIIVFMFNAFASQFGIEHKLLTYGAAPDWTYSDMRGFGPSIGPWLWFKLYWGAWGLLLMVAAKLFWVRGREQGLAARLKLARRRLTRSTAGIAAAAAALIVTLGGFIFYNTNVLNAYETASDKVGQRAEYERRYGQYEDIPQPRLSSATLRVEIFPERREAEIRGSYRLVNKSGVGIDSIHLATASEVETEPADFDRPAKLVLDDTQLGYRIYALETPLLPGDSMQLSFVVRFQTRGFTNKGIDPSVAANGTFFEGNDWLPALGYQPDRELRGSGERSAHGLPARRPDIRSLDDFQARPDMTGSDRITLETIVGTTENQIALAPGELRRTWTENGRRYFDYATNVPILNDFAFYSAAYAVRETQWNDVAIQIFHNPQHTLNLDRMIQGVQASLEYFSKHLGPYPHHVIRLVEHQGDWITLHSAPINMSYEEGFSLINSKADPRDIDFPFAVVAHEMAHQWWGNQLSPAKVEGGLLLTESLAWYAAMGVIQETYGDEHLRRLLRVFREDALTPRTRASLPLLRSYDPYWAYRKGPFAMYALQEYVGSERVDAALRNFFEKQRSGAPPLPTSLDLYKELQAVTPESLRYLLADLFERNTFWELEAKQVTATPVELGGWEVTLEVQARKLVVDTAGFETEVPMDDLVEVGVYAAGESGKLGEPLYRQLHRVRSGEQRITVMVPKEPARAGVDPRNLLIDVTPDDNLKEITWP
jgi:ABC-2 type transport system permease protein